MRYMKHSYTHQTVMFVVAMVYLSPFEQHPDPHLYDNYYSLYLNYKENDYLVVYQDNYDIGQMVDFAKFQHLNLLLSPCNI